MKASTGSSADSVKPISRRHRAFILYQWKGSTVTITYSIATMSPLI